MQRMGKIWLICVAGILLAVVAPAQWLNYPTPGLPREGGKPNLTAPTPRTADGKPDLTGVWLSDNGMHYRDLAMDMGPGVTVEGYRAKDGSNLGNAVSVTFPDGRKMKGRNPDA